MHLSKYVLVAMGSNIKKPKYEFGLQNYNFVFLINPWGNVNCAKIVYLPLNEKLKNFTFIKLKFYSSCHHVINLGFGLLRIKCRHLIPIFFRFCIPWFLNRLTLPILWYKSNLHIKAQLLSLLWGGGVFLKDKNR